jgi:hypothetical protein
LAQQYAIRFLLYLNPKIIGKKSHVTHLEAFLHLGHDRGDGFLIGASDDQVIYVDTND